MRIATRWISGIVVVAVVLLVGVQVARRLAAADPGTARGLREARPIPVEVADVTQGAIENRRTFSGTLEATARVTVAPKIAGRIVRLPVELADLIRRNQVVAELDRDEYDQEVMQAEAELAVARANVAEAESAAKIAARELERMQTLQIRGVASESQLDVVMADDLAKSAAVEVAKARATRSESALQTARIRRGYTTIEATWSGEDEERVVAERFVEEGETVAANTPLLSIIRLDPIRAVIYVTERDYAELAPGQPVTLRTDAYSDRRWSGRIGRVAPAFREGSRQARVEVDVANEDGRLKPGMFVRVEAVLGRRDDATIVPASALVERGGGTVLFIVNADGASVRQVPVETGIRERDRVDVTGDGVEGRVVTLGQQLLDDGSMITIPDASADAPPPLMNLPRASVRRPVFTSMVTLIVITLGVMALRELRIDLLPAVEMPTLTVSTGYEGASPEVMERLVTQIAEEIIATVPGVEEMTSTSSEGNSRIRVRFAWGVNVDEAATDVRAKLEDELDELPDEVDRPQIRKFDVNSFPVVLLGIASRLDPIELTTLIEDQVRDRFARLPGVAQVDMWGGYTREIRVELEPERVRALGLPLNQVLQAIRDANLDLPAGEIEQGRYEVTLRAPAEFAGLDEIRDTVVAVREGAPVTLGQIATVRDTYERLRRIVRVNRELGLRMAIRKQADANTVEVSRAILGEIDRVNRDLPQIDVFPVINQGNFIERSIQNVANSVLYGGGLAVLVLIFFLRNLRSTIVISLAIPISIVATFALIYFNGFTLNLMTLGGLALGVGMMVDSSIVVLENIFRRRTEDGEDGPTAAVAGATEVGPAIVASTITTLVIFLPLLFVEGVSGVLFKELAYVIGFSLVCSLAVSLSVVPMLASKLPAPAGDDNGSRAGGLSRFATDAFAALDNAYRDLLRRVLRHRLMTIAAAFAALAASLLLVPLIGTEFLPPSDEGEVRVTGEMEVGSRLDLVDRQTRLIEEVVFEGVPEMIASVTSIGASGRNPGEGTTGEIRISLVPSKDRERSNVEIASTLRSALDGKIPGMTIRTRAPQGQFLLERILGSDEGLEVEVRGFDLDTLAVLSDRAMAALRDIPGITDVDTSRDTGTPQEQVRIDRAKAADVGVSVRDIVEAIETAVAGSRAGEYRTRGNSYRILVQFKDAQRLSIDDVLDLTVRSESGEDIPLRNLVTTDSGRGPTLIERSDQQRTVTVTANIAGRDLGSVAADARAALDQIPRPVGYELSLAGNVEEQQKSTRELITSLLLALALVYMVLACQYESLRDPVIVMTSVPLAAIGVLVTLFLTETTLNVQSYIGCIMLGGIVVNNAILLVDQAGQLRTRRGLRTSEAVVEAGRRRLRPILMTSLTTILGLMPLALGIGEGADAQAPLARAVIGGLAVSMLITLVLVPAVYSLFHPEYAAPAVTTEPRGMAAT